MVFECATFKEAVQLFGMYCKAKGLADRTIETYLFALDCLHRFVQDRVEGPSIPTCDVLRAFVAWMLEKGLSRHTIRIRMRSVRVFFNFLQREGVVQVNPMQGVEIPRAQ